MPTLTRSLRRIGRYAFLVLIVIITWEACARIQDQITLGVPSWDLQYVAPRFYQHDANGVHGIPNVRSGKFQMNSLGFRGPELQPNRVTILCLGASETFGVEESEGFEYPRQLERQLNLHDGRERYQVVNAALPSERVSEIDAALPRILAETHPALAVVYTSAASVMWTDAQWEAHRPGPAAKDPPQERYGRLRVRDRFERWLRSTLPPSTFIDAALDATAPPQQRPAFLYHDAVRVSRLPESNFAAYRRQLEHTVDLLEAAHVRPILMTHATRFGPDGRYRDKQFAVAMDIIDVVTPAGFFDAERRMNAVVRNIARDRDVALVDAANVMPPGPDDFADYFHFTDAGSGKIASLLATTVEAADSNRLRMVTRARSRSGPGAAL